MSIFHEVGLSWKGEEFTVPHDRVMGLIEVIEEVVTIQDLTSKNGVKFGKISRAYSDALKYAGARGATQEQVYSAMIGGSGEGVAIQEAVNSLLMLMIPPEHLQESPPPKTTTPRKRRRKASKG